MANPTSQLQQVNTIVEKAKSYGVIHLTTDGTPMPDRRFLHINGQTLLNFSSCNYVGLEADPRLKEAGIKAIEKYGVQFYSARTYVSLKYYEELEDLLSQMFEKPTIVMPTTMLGHLTSLPVLVGEKDAVILDHQVHTSIQMTTQILKDNGAHVEMIRHDRMDYLENRINKLKGKYHKVWYFADGVYSMYGNIASFSKLHELLVQYEQFHLYVDDCHGMSWTGKNGTGTVMERIPYHPRMVVITSMGKAFGASGGIGVFYDEKIKKLIRNCGKPLIFTGPLLPPALGAAVASAKIHLTPEIIDLQNVLKKRMRFFLEKGRLFNLPILGDGESPIFYLGVGKPDASFRLCALLKEAGFYSCVASYPAVSAQRSGVRFLLTVHHTEDDILKLLYELVKLLPKVLSQYKTPMSKINKLFKLNIENNISADS